MRFAKILPHASSRACARLHLTFIRAAPRTGNPFMPTDAAQAKALGPILRHSPGFPGWLASQN